MKRQKLIKRLADRSFRRAFAEEAVNVGIPIQIREMRKARRWTQKQLGEIAGVDQEAVSRAEKLNYGRFALATLKNLADAFDCALIVRFAPFSELLAWKDHIDAATVTPADFDHDTALARDQDVRPVVTDSVTNLNQYVLNLLREEQKRANSLEEQYGSDRGTESGGLALFSFGTN